MGNKLAVPIMQNIPIGRINIGQRRRQDYQDLDLLKADILENGLIQPIAVKADDYDDVEYAPDEPLSPLYTLLAGGRRLEACTQLGHATIPARIYPPDLDELDIRTIELAENMKRANLLYPEEARLTREIHDLQVAKYGPKLSTAPDAPGHSMADTAAILGRSAASVTQEIALANAMDRLPILETCKNKTEALKVMAKIKEEIVHNELSKRVTQRMEESGGDKAKKALCDSYIIASIERGCEGVKDGTIDLVEMDPPYGIELRKTVIADPTQIKQLMGEANLDHEAYRKQMMAWYTLAYNKLKPNGWLILWFALEPWFEDTYQILHEVGFELSRIPGFWIKNNGNTRTPNVHLANAVEPFFYARKGNPVMNRPGHLNTFSYKMLTNKIHPTEKPIDLYSDIFSTFCLPSSTIMVGFLGSGNALMGAANVGSRAFGFDMSEQYKAQYILRVEAAQPGYYTSYK